MLRGISISQLWKGLEPPFLHSVLSPMALYQNPEFQEDQKNSKFQPFQCWDIEVFIMA